MITILHGAHIESSRAELNRLIASGQSGDVRRVDGKSVDANTLTQAIESSSLFGGGITIIIERLFAGLGRQAKKIAAYAAILENAGDSTIILWEDKELTPGILKQFGPKTTVRLFKLPVLIFTFLDSIKPGSASSLLPLYERVVSGEAPELVFSMMAKRVRQLMAIADGQMPKELAPWQASRLTTQAKSFTMSELVTLYGKLSDAEYAVKSGASPFSLREQVELILIEL